MIVGIGIDIVNISRLEGVLSRHGDRFLERIFTAHERQFAQRFPNQTGVLAKRWAAKEACSKALGTGMRQGVRWRDLEVRNLKNGFPSMNIHGKAKVRLDELVPQGWESEIFLTMSDDYPWAIAKIVIQARKCGEPTLATSGNKK